MENKYTPESFFEFDEEKQSISKYHFGGPKTVIIPDRINGKQVLEIGEAAFSKNKLIYLEIPDSVNRIANHAFSENKLTNLRIPNSVISIGDRAFANNCLTNLVIPDSVLNIGEFAFYANRLSSVSLPNSILFIRKYAFARNRLTSITIPKYAIKIYDRAFAGNKFNKIQYNSVHISEETYVENYAFGDRNELYIYRDETKWYKNPAKGARCYNSNTGSIYKGDTSRGIPYGSGELVNKIGIKYIGGFKEGKFDGKGTLWSKDGVIIYDGRFKEGNFNDHRMKTTGDYNKKELPEATIKTDLTQHVAPMIIGQIIGGRIGRTLGREHGWNFIGTILGVIIVIVIIVIAIIIIAIIVGLFYVDWQEIFREFS